MAAPNPPDEDLEQLVRQAQSGNEEAFRRLVERCHTQVYRWALVRTGDADDADDVAQEVLVRLSTHLDRYDGRSRYHVALSRHGKRRRWLLPTWGRAAANDRTH